MGLASKEGVERSGFLPAEARVSLAVAVTAAADSGRNGH